MITHVVVTIRRPGDVKTQHVGPRAKDVLRWNPSPKASECRRECKDRIETIDRTDEGGEKHGQTPHE